MDKTYKCEFCKSSFDNKAFLNKHQKNTKYCLLIQTKKDDNIEGKENINKKAKKDVNIEGKENINKKAKKDVNKEGKENINKKAKKDDNKEGKENINKKAKKDVNIEGKENINKKPKKDVNIEGKENIKQKKFNRCRKRYRKISTHSPLYTKANINKEFEEVNTEVNTKVNTKVEESKIEDITVFKKRLKDLMNEKEIIEKDINNIKKYNEYLKNTEITILNYLSITLANSNFSGNKVLYIIIDLMKFINNYNIESSDKKTIILKLLKNTENIFNFDDNTKYFIENISSELIDIIVSIDKQNISLKNLESCFLPLCI